MINIAMSMRDQCARSSINICLLSASTQETLMSVGEVDVARVEALRRRSRSRT